MSLAESRLAKSLNRPLTKDRLTIVPYYPLDYDKSTFKNKATCYDVCFTAMDGYRVVETLETKKQAQDFIDNFKDQE